jgi:hypothetical protein
MKQADCLEDLRRRERKKTVKWILNKYNGWFAMNSTAIQYKKWQAFVNTVMNLRSINA